MISFINISKFIRKLLITMFFYFIAFDKFKNKYLNNNSYIIFREKILPSLSIILDINSVHFKVDAYNSSSITLNHSNVAVVEEPYFIINT